MKKLIPFHNERDWYRMSAALRQTIDKLSIVRVAIKGGKGGKITVYEQKGDNATHPEQAVGIHR